MARLTRYNGGAFYDAFGGKIGEVEEVWAGDSFDRDAACCNYVSAADSGELSFTVKSDTDVFSPRLAITTDSAYFNEKLCELQEQIDALKGTFKALKGIRAALKTLQYVREIK